MQCRWKAVVFELCQWTGKLHSLSERPSTFILIAWRAVFVELSSLILYKYFLCTFREIFSSFLIGQAFIKMVWCWDLKDLGICCFTVLLFHCHLVHQSIFNIWWDNIFQLPIDRHCKGLSVGDEPARQWHIHLGGKNIDMWECGQGGTNCSVQLYQQGTCWGFFNRDYSHILPAQTSCNKKRLSKDIWFKILV